MIRKTIMEPKIWPTGSLSKTRGFLTKGGVVLCKI